MVCGCDGGGGCGSIVGVWVMVSVALGNGCVMHAVIVVFVLWS